MDLNNLKDIEICEDCNFLFMPNEIDSYCLQRYCNTCLKKKQR